MKFIWYIYIVFMCFDCALSIAIFEIAVIILKIQQYAQKMDKLRVHAIPSLPVQCLCL